MLLGERFFLVIDQSAAVPLNDLPGTELVGGFIAHGPREGVEAVGADLKQDAILGPDAGLSLRGAVVGNGEDGALDVNVPI